MALFGFRKNQPAEGEDKAPEGGFAADPAKARKWFEHGRKMASSSNFEYALTCFASAVKFDPSDMAVHEAMLDAARKFLAAGGKAASSKDVKQIDGPGPVDRFAAAEFVWMRDLNNLSAAMKLLEATGKAGQDAFGAWLAPMVMNMLRAQKKPSKSMYVQAKDRFSSVGAWNEAFLAGEEAVRLDPSDTELIAELKQLTAQRAITQGGYAEAAEAGEGGGFRTFVKDMDKQRELEAAESISGTADSQRIAIEKARKDLAANPASPEAVAKLGQLLRRTGEVEDEEAARTVYLEAFDRLNEYRFKAAAADIDLARLRREVRAAEERIAEGGGEDAKAALADAERRLLEREQTEYGERVEKYPTDRRLKLDLGRVLVKLERFEDAMACFQECKDEPKFRVESAHMLGLCFARSGWHPEAVSEFREALENIDATERDRELSIRYDLMLSLIELAKEQRSLEHAREAAEICSQIIRKNISFRDIRERRKEIDEVTRELAPPA